MHTERFAPRVSNPAYQLAQLSDAEARQLLHHLLDGIDVVAEIQAEGDLKHQAAVYVMAELPRDVFDRLATWDADGDPDIDRSPGMPDELEGDPCDCGEPDNEGGYERYQLQRGRQSSRPVCRRPVFSFRPDGSVDRWRPLPRHLPHPSRRRR